MLEVFTEAAHWLGQGYEVALATVVRTEGSTPRECGTVMAVNDLGQVSGSISGGCVEAAVVEEAIALIQDREAPPQLMTFGTADDLGLGIGLTCGGVLQVFIERLEWGVESVGINTGINTWGAGRSHGASPTPLLFGQFIEQVQQSQHHSFVLCTVVQGMGLGAKLLIPQQGNPLGTLGSTALDQQVIADRSRFLNQKTCGLYRYGGDSGDVDGVGFRSPGSLPPGVTLFVQTWNPQPHLILLGAMDFSRALCQLGKLMGYRVTVCDGRSRFVTAERFPEADNLVNEWPHRYLQCTALAGEINAETVIVVLTHDPKFDVPALQEAVQTPARYIGAMGSRRTTADRWQRLVEAGLTPADLKRISAPVGLDLGARTPMETAVSIMAEAIALREGRQGGRLCDNQNPIHATGIQRLQPITQEQQSQTGALGHPLEQEVVPIW